MEALAHQQTESIRQWTRDEVFESVRECFMEALGVEHEEVHLQATVIDDLGAESLDFLDIAFRLERAFEIKIPRGNIKAKSQEGIEDQYEVDGVLTPLALDKLREIMPEVDPAQITEGLTTKDIPRLFLVETFYNICVHMLTEKDALA
jgi:acyl carrier protein